MHRHLALTLSFFFGLCVTRPTTAMAQRSEIIVQGRSVDSDSLADSLSVPYWRALAATACPRVKWQADYRSPASYEESVLPLRQRLKLATGALLPPAGSVLNRRVVSRGDRYTIERVVAEDRIPNSGEFGYLVRPVGNATPSPVVVLLHGSGMHPREAFDLDMTAQYRPGERASHASFVGSAIELAEAGYTIFVPWLADDQGSDRFPMFPWSLVERHGSSLAARVPYGGTYHLLVNEVAGALDFLLSLADVDPLKVAVIGWSEGAQLASVAAAMDNRIGAVVRLDSPLDRHALRNTITGVFNGAASTHMDCALGDVEMAALTAPRSLLYAYSTRDESVARYLPFASAAIQQRMRLLYEGFGRGSSLAVQADSQWSVANARAVRVWLDSQLDFVPRAVPDRPPRPRFQIVDSYNDPQIAELNQQRTEYISTMGSCKALGINPSFDSPAAYLMSVAPLRQRVGRVMNIEAISSSQAFRVVKRYVVSRQPRYTLEFVDIASTRSSMPVMGLLATPTDARGPLPAVISFGANYGLARPFGLPVAERSPYLTSYAADLANAGHVVFAPYLPLSFPEVAAAEIRARNPGGATSFSMAVSMYSGAIDFVRSLSTVDTTSITAWGISYSATAALFTTAFDSRITTLVYSNPILTTSVLFANPDAAILSPWYPEVCATVDVTLKYLIAPRRLIRENGVRDANGYEVTPLETVSAIQANYTSLGLGSQFILVRHAGAHETRAKTLLDTEH